MVTPVDQLHCSFALSFCVAAGTDPSVPSCSGQQVLEGNKRRNECNHLQSRGPRHDSWHVSYASSSVYRT